MKEVNYKGLVLDLGQDRYFQVREGKDYSINQDLVTSTLTLEYPKGSTSKDISEHLGLEHSGDTQVMEPMPRASKWEEVLVSLNGLKLRKKTWDTHIIHLIIVGDTESRVSQDYTQTTIVVSEKDATNPEFINFLFWSGNLKYLSPVGPRPKNWEITNFPRITVKNKSLSLESTSKYIYYLRRKYNDYVIRSIDYQDQFIKEISRILKDYGIELVRANKEKALKTTSHISYQFSQTPVRYSRARSTNEEDKMLHHKIPVDFILRCTDMVMFFDFKNKYSNLDILTNFCEFKTTDKYGHRWTAAIKWTGISEEFNHLYQSDDNSNFSYQGQFRAELYFYEVIDDRHKFLQEILHNLEEGN